MKRRICVIVVCILVFCITACSTETQRVHYSVNFYYRSYPVEFGPDSGVIAVEVRNAKTHANDYGYLLEQYLNGPRVSNCISPFPAGTTLKEFNISESSAKVILSPHLTKLSDSELMIACICLARTLFDLTSVQSVQIGAQNSLLNSQQYITITTDNFELWDSNFAQVD